MKNFFRLSYFRIFVFIFCFLSLSQVFAQCSLEINGSQNPGIISVCPNGSIQLTASGNNNNGNYTWSPGTGLDTTSGAAVVFTASPSISFPVTLTVSVTCSTGTTLSNSVTIDLANGPDASLSGSFFYLPRLFKFCGPGVTQNTFIFTNASTTTSINTNYNISFGNGQPDFNGPVFPSSISQTFLAGSYNMVYTVTSQNGCVDTTNYTVFVGNVPQVNFGYVGNTEICSGDSIEFLLNNVSNNTPGTVYTFTVNDGSNPLVFQHPPPATIFHVFNSTSCGTNSMGGSTTYQNAFMAELRVRNPCGQASGSVVPIYVSEAPTASFSSSGSSTVCFTNTSTGISINSSLGGGNSICTAPRLVWEIAGPVIPLVSSGSLGNSFGSSNSFGWIQGSDSLCLNFIAPGVYTVSLIAGTACGLDTSTQTINVVSSGVHQINNTPGLILYPNPADRFVHIQSSEPISIDHVRVFSMDGRTMIIHGFQSIENGIKLSTDILADGMYTVSICNEEGFCFNRRLLIKH